MHACNHKQLLYDLKDVSYILWSLQLLDENSSDIFWADSGAKSVLY